MRKTKPIKTTHSVKQLLDDWNSHLSQKKGMSIKKYESDDVFARIARQKLFKEKSHDTEYIPKKGRGRAKIVYKI